MHFTVDVVQEGEMRSQNETTGEERDFDTECDTDTEVNTWTNDLKGKEKRKWRYDTYDEKRVTV